MSGKEARDLIQQYVNGWKENNLEKILSTLTKESVIIESHGPTYYGLEDVESWVKSWIKGDWKVNSWDITSFLSSEDIVVFEWVFTFSSKGTKPRTIEGISIARLKNYKILSLREYRTTKPLYNWRPEKKLATF